MTPAGKSRDVLVTTPAQVFVICNAYLCLVGHLFIDDAVVPVGQVLAPLSAVGDRTITLLSYWLSL